MSDFSEIRRLQEERKLSGENVDGDRVALNGHGAFDSELYGGSDSKDKYLSSVPANDDFEDDDEDENPSAHPSTRARINAPKALLDQLVEGGDAADNTVQYREQFGSGLVNTRIADRESEVFFVSMS